jgi:hypothetical protein
MRSCSINVRTKSNSSLLATGNLVPPLDQQVEHRQLAGRGHRDGKGLIAIAQVGGQPARRPVLYPARPGALRQIDSGGRTVAPVSEIRFHDCSFSVATGGGECRPFEWMSTAGVARRPQEIDIRVLDDISEPVHSQAAHRAGVQGQCDAGYGG